MKPNDTTQGNDPGRIEPLSLEAFKDALEGLKSIPIAPRKCFYCDQITYGKILDGMVTDANYSIYIPLGGIQLIADNDIEPGTIIYCEPGLYDIWKSLKTSPWINQNSRDVNLWNVAETLFKWDNDNKIKVPDSIIPKFFREDPDIMSGPEWPIYNPFKYRKPRIKHTKKCRIPRRLKKDMRNILKGRKVNKNIP